MSPVFDGLSVDFMEVCLPSPPPTTHCWSCGASLVPACMFSYVDEFVYVYECVRACVFVDNVQFYVSILK